MKIYATFFLIPLLHIHQLSAQVPTRVPTRTPTNNPSRSPSLLPSSSPSTFPTVDPSIQPSFEPTAEPTVDPSTVPTLEPTEAPSSEPTLDPSESPTMPPSTAATQVTTSAVPSITPSSSVTSVSSIVPSALPTIAIFAPSAAPSLISTQNTDSPTIFHSQAPTTPQTGIPSTFPSLAPVPSISLTPSIGVAMGDRCFKIAAFDNFGDGWDTAKLFLFDSMGKYTSYAPDTTNNNEIHLSYCFHPTPVEGDYVIITVVGYQPNFAWEIEWQVMLSSGAVFLGTYDTTMTFAFTYGCPDSSSVNCQPTVSLIQTENLVDESGKSCSDVFRHTCVTDDDYSDPNASNLKTFGDSEAGPKKFAKEVSKRSKKPVASPTQIPSYGPSADPTSPYKEESENDSPGDDKPKPKPAPKAPPKPAPKVAPYYSDNSYDYVQDKTPAKWGDLGVDNAVNEDSSRSKSSPSGRKNATDSNAQWGGMDWLGSGKAAPELNDASKKVSSGSDNKKDKNVQQWGGLDWDTPGKKVPSPSSKPSGGTPSSRTKSSRKGFKSTVTLQSNVDDDDDSAGDKPKPKPKPAVADSSTSSEIAYRNSSAYQSTMVQLFGYNDVWYRSNGLSTMYSISDEVGRRRFDYGTLCPGGVTVSGVTSSGDGCVRYLDDGPYVFRVNGALDPSKKDVKWKFCNTNGTVMMELLFMMTDGSCMPLRNRPISLVVTLGAQKFENDEIIIRANILYGSSYKAKYSESRRLSELILPEMELEKDILSGVMSEEFQATLSQNENMRNKVAMTSWKMHDPTDDSAVAGAAVREAAFQIKVSPSAYGVNAGNEEQLHTLGSNLKAHFSKTMHNGLFLAHLKSAAVSRNVGSLAHIDFVELVSLEVNHLVNVNKEVSGIADVVVVLGCVMALAAIALFLNGFRKSPQNRVYSPVPKESTESLHGRFSRQAEDCL